MSRLGALNVLIIEFSFHEEHFIFRITASLSIFITFSASKQPAGTGRPLGPFYFFFFLHPYMQIIPRSIRGERFNALSVSNSSTDSSSNNYCFEPSFLRSRPSSTRETRLFLRLSLHQLFNPHQQSNTSSYTVGNYLQILFRNNIFIFSISLRYIN